VNTRHKKQPKTKFAVVNNGRYAGFLQHGRHKALAALGLSVEGFQAAGTLMALSELNLRYKAPLRAGDAFVVTTAVAAISAARLTLEQRVLRRVEVDGDELQLACEGEATVVFLDASYKPIRTPAAVREAFDAKFAQRKAGGVAD
jgi:acyl-CoA thioester hydrolase